MFDLHMQVHPANNQAVTMTVEGQQLSFTQSPTDDLPLPVANHQAWVVGGRDDWADEHHIDQGDLHVVVRTPYLYAEPGLIDAVESMVSNGHVIGDATFTGSRDWSTTLEPAH